MITSYSKIYNFGHRAIAELLDYEVQVEEKLDGSQFSFGIIDGHLQFRSKGAIIQADAPPKLFALAVQSVKDRADKLTEGWVYRGEAICSKRHNSITYGRIPTGGVMIFDIEGPFGPNGSWDFLRASERYNAAQHIGFEAVPVLFIGNLTSDRFPTLIERESILGEAQIEGVVVKPTQYNVWGIDKKVLMGKHVREDFKELNRATWTQGKSSLDKVIDAVRSNEARWTKAVQYLRDAGTLQMEPEDIGALMKRVSEDVLEEEGDNLKEAIFKILWKERINRAVTAGLAEWYKDLLVLEQFRDKE